MEIDTTEIQRDLMETAKEYVSMVKRIRETGVLSADDAARIAEGLAFLYGHIAWRETSVHRHSL